MNAPSLNSQISIIVLAAGESSRMGRPKQLLPYRGTSLLRHTVEQAMSVPDAQVVVVLGAFAEKIRPVLDGLPVLVAENPEWHTGMGSTLRAGLEAALLANSETTAAIFLLCDQPLLSPAILESLLQAHRTTAATIVASEYGDALGVPALFRRSHFPELLGLNGKDGARLVILRHREEALGIPFADGAIDIDTPDDYAGLHNLQIADCPRVDLKACWQVGEWG